MAKRTITIESAHGNVLSAQIEEELVDKFIRQATDKKGSFRGRKESFQHALESALVAALSRFMEP